MEPSHYVGLDVAQELTIAVLPIFVAATEGKTGPQQRKTALIAVATCVVAGFIVLFVGNAVLGFFGVSV